MARMYATFWMPVSTRRTVVNTPSTNTVGRTTARKGANATSDWDTKPRATSVLEGDSTKRDARVPLSLTVVLAADCKTKYSLLSAPTNAASRSASSTIDLHELSPLRGGRSTTSGCRDRPGHRCVEARLHRRGLFVAAQPVQALRVAVEAPDVVGVPGDAAMRGV